MGGMACGAVGTDIGGTGTVGVIAGTALAGVGGQSAKS